MFKEQLKTENVKLSEMSLIFSVKERKSIMYSQEMKQQMKIINELVQLQEKETREKMDKTKKNAKHEMLKTSMGDEEEMTFGQYMDYIETMSKINTAGKNN